MSEDEVVARLGHLYSAVVSDVLDGLGLRQQTARPGVLALGAPQRVVGRAFTMLVERVDEPPENLYATQFEAVDRLVPGDVMVVAAPVDVPSAFWGELITTRAMNRGCVGAFIDGYTRDLAAIRTYGFALWARGSHPADSAGRLDAVAYQEPVEWSGVRVEPGDVVLADADGVVVVPAAAAEQVASLAESKAAVEDDVRRELRDGASVTEVFGRYGVM